MKNLLNYKGYCGTVEYSVEDDMLCGKIIGINSLILYSGKSVEEIKKDFENSVDDYLEECAADGIEPEKQYFGKLNIRLKPETHRMADRLASSENISLNNFIELAVEERIKHSVG